jgi:hypothetical protein
MVTRSASRAQLKKFTPSCNNVQPKVISRVLFPMPVWPETDQPKPISASLPDGWQEIGCAFFVTFFAQAKKVKAE